MDIAHRKFDLSSDTKNNLKYLASGELVYNAGSLGIVHETNKNVQRFFDQHRDDCLCVAVHPDGVTVATGELFSRPAIYVWNSKTMRLQAIAKQGLTKGVDNLAFSPDGTLLLATTMDTIKKVVIFDSPGGDSYDMITIDEVTDQPFFAICWVNQTDFIGVGPGFFRYWSIADDEMLCLTGEFLEGSCTVLLCAAVLPNGNIACGCATGELQKWQQGYQQPVSNIHYGVGPLEAIHVTKKL